MRSKCYTIKEFIDRSYLDSKLIFFCLYLMFNTTQLLIGISTDLDSTINKLSNTLSYFSPLPEASGNADTGNIGMISKYTSGK